MSAGTSVDGIRERLNANRPLAVGAVCGVIALALLTIVMQANPSYVEPEPAGNEQFYSSDDGKTYFVAEAGKPAPWRTPDGKVAVVAHVFRCDGGEPFVSYLEKYTDANLRRAKAGVHGVNTVIKRPGDAEWVAPSDATREEYKRIATPTCKDGSTPERVAP